MNILLVNHYAGSPEMGMEFRPWYMARAWKAMGHSVLIISASQAHVRNIQFDVTQKISMHNVSGVDYLVVKTAPYKGNSLGRIKNMMAFVRGIYKSKRLIADYFTPDVVIASSTYPLDIYPSRKLAKRFNAKLAFEVHDLWPLSPMELGGYSHRHPFIMIMQHAENYAYKHSDKVISMLPNALEHMKDHGLKDTKFHHVPNGIVVEDWDKSKNLADNHEQIIYKAREDGNILVGYAGSHGIANALPSVIKAMENLQNQKITLFLIGDGPEKQKLINLCEQKKLNNIIFLDPINKNLIPAFLDKMDILYIGLQNQSLFRFGISPNKLIDYLMAGKPIVQAINAGNDIVGDAGCGFSVEAENSEQIADAIEKIANMNKEERAKLGKRGHEYCISNHDYQVLAAKIISILK